MALQVHYYQFGVQQIHLERDNDTGKTLDSTMICVVITNEEELVKTGLLSAQIFFP